MATTLAFLPSFNIPYEMYGELWERAASSGKGQLSHQDNFVVLGTRQPAQEAMEFSFLTIF